MATKLVFLPYLQSWDGSSLHIRLLVIPRDNPLDPLIAGAPNFPNAKFAFEVHLLPGLGPIPTLGGTPTSVVDEPVVATAAPLFAALEAQFQIDPAPPPANPRPAGTQIKKHLPTSYQTAAQYVAGRTALVSTDDTYACALNAPPAQPFVKLPPANPKVAWGRVIAALLRQPVLAQGARLMRPLDIAVTPANSLNAGGWLYVTLAPSSDGAGLLAVPDGLKIYGTRIPPLTGSRTLFTPVLFPVAAMPSGLSYDEPFAEADNYNDGFAKIVHAGQPQQLDPLQETPDGTRPVKELGLRIGWDDEQVTIWCNRQIDPASATLDAQMGVAGYHIDSRPVGDPTWHSLCLAQGPVKVGTVDLSEFSGELAIETHPVQLRAQSTGDFWLPSYFTSWHGPSLVGLDTLGIVLSGGSDNSDPNRVQAVAPDVALRYGTDYQLRVRLADHTGGGPEPVDAPSVPGPSPTTTQPCRRWIRPSRPTVANPPPTMPDPANPPASLTVTRPLLTYPAVTLTGAYANAAALLTADLPNAIAAQREPGLPDPDVTMVQITVEAQGLAQDPLSDNSGYQALYQTTRAFPSDPAQPLTLDLSWTDIHDATTLVAPASGPLLLPTARNLRLQIASLGREDPTHSYFGADDVRLGPATFVSLRKDSADETALFASDLPTHRFSALFLQPDPPVDATVAFAQRAAGAGGQRPSDVPTRLAGQLGLTNDGLMFRAPPGRRVVFGCAATIRHVLGPDGSTITFASQSDLTQHWIVVIRLTLDRDWTWDGLAYSGVTVTRDGQTVGQFAPDRGVNADALVSPMRAQTDLVFLDSIDPKPAPGMFPAELHPSYQIATTLLGNPAQDLSIELAIDLPVTTPPAQTPRLVSAGIAMSPYQRSADYSSTESRQKALWFEFDSAPNDPEDRYFVRVLRNAPDPLLSSLGQSVAETAEPPLPVDPESLRAIVQGQSDDRAGLGAMQPLVASDSPVHFMVPLPPGVHETSPELFGFFTYELRTGHAGLWSTAQGRFGALLRVSGVQHPAPILTCSPVRNTQGITVSTDFALSALDGRDFQRVPPASSIWVLLYTQAEQVDGADRRNVLLLRKPARWDRVGYDQSPASYSFGVASFGAAEVALALETLGFAATAPLSVLAVELLPNGISPADPLGAQLGAQRILRSSPLVPVPAIC